MTRKFSRAATAELTTWRDFEQAFRVLLEVMD